MLTYEGNTGIQMLQGEFGVVVVVEGKQSKNNQVQNVTLALIQCSAVQMGEFEPKLKKRNITK